MATTREQPLLADPETSQAHRSGNAFAAKAFGLASLIGATVALCIFYSSAVASRAPLQQSQLVGAFTVDNLNNILQSIEITDADDDFRTLPTSQLKMLFQDFLSNHGSTAPTTDGTFLRDIGPRNHYDSLEEHEYRLGVFSKNLLDVLHQNANSRRNNPEEFRARFGITEFADWTPQEIKFMCSMSGMNMTEANEQLTKDKAATHDMVPKDSSSGIGTDVSAVSLVSLPQCYLYFPVRNQGQCGDCWAFSTAETIRSRLWRQHRTNSGKLSVQQLVDCYPNDLGKRCPDGVNGCCGGWPSQAINYLHKSGGIATTETYGPLISDQDGFRRESCKTDKPKAVLPGVALFPKTETIMAQWLCSYGAISIALDAAPLHRYTGGLVGPRDCSKKMTHAVILVGIDTVTYTSRNGEKAPIWIMQNSWGTGFGVSATRPYSRGGGFALLQWGFNTCGLAQAATLPSSADRIR